MFDDIWTWILALLAAYVISQIASSLMASLAKRNNNNKTTPQPIVVTSPAPPKVDEPPPPPVAAAPPPVVIFTPEEDDILNSAFEATAKSYDLLDTAFDRVADRGERKKNAKENVARHRFREALKDVEFCLETAPNDVPMLALKCECHVGLMQFKQALAVGQKLVAISPKGSEGPTWLAATHEAMDNMGSSMKVWRDAASDGILPFSTTFPRKCDDVSGRIRGAVSSGHTSPLITHHDTKMMCYAKYLADNASKEETVSHLNKVWAVVGRSQLVSYLD